MHVILLPCLAGAPSSCYLELLYDLQKRYAGLTVLYLLDTSLKPLVHRRNVASLGLFYRYSFGRCSSELLTQPGPVTCYSDTLHDFLSLPPDVTRMSMSTVSFLDHLDSGIICL